MYDPLREQFYTTNELAEILNIKPETLASHARCGRLPASQPYPKGPWLFPKDEITAYLRKRLKKTPSFTPNPLRARAQFSQRTTKNTFIKRSVQ
jgi:excisionase family DNA binding protein